MKAQLDAAWRQWLAEEAQARDEIRAWAEIRAWDEARATVFHTRYGFGLQLPRLYHFITEVRRICGDGVSVEWQGRDCIVAGVMLFKGEL